MLVFMQSWVTNLKKVDPINIESESENQAKKTPFVLPNIKTDITTLI